MSVLEDMAKVNQLVGASPIVGYTNIHVTLDLTPALYQFLETLGAQIVATLADFTTKLDALDTAVASIATEIAALKAQIAAGGLDPADEATVLARLDTLTAAIAAAQ